MMLDVVQRYSSMAESSSNIDNAIPVGVGGSGASGVVTCVELLGGRRPAGHIRTLDAPRTQKMIACSSSSACSRTNCCSSGSTDRSSRPSLILKPPAPSPTLTGSKLERT